MSEIADNTKKKMSGVVSSVLLPRDPELKFTYLEIIVKLQLRPMGIVQRFQVHRRG